MNVFTFLFLVVAAALCAGVMKTYLKERNLRADSAEDMQRTLAKMDALEERVQVLERIVTERRIDLKQKIDSL